MTPERMAQLSLLEIRATKEETGWLLNRIGELECAARDVLRKIVQTGAPWREEYTTMIEVLGDDKPCALESNTEGKGG